MTGREHPIIFSASMVRAILAGEKTQTRRVIKIQPPQQYPHYAGTVGTYSGVPEPRHFWSNHESTEAAYEADDDFLQWPGEDPNDDEDAEYGYYGPGGMESPYGSERNCMKPAARLWVRESFLLDPDADADAWDTAPLPYISWADSRTPSLLPEALRTPDSVLYAATWEGIPLRWKSPIFMPRWASRLTLEITDVRVERLQDSSEEDAKAEGVAPKFEMDAANCMHGAPVVPTYALGVKHVWKDIHGPESWEANPWVWVLSFRVVSS